MKETEYRILDTLSNFVVGAIIGVFVGLGLLYWFLSENTTGMQMALYILGPALGIGLYCALFGTKGPSRATESYFDWIRWWRWWR